MVLRRTRGVVLAGAMALGSVGVGVGFGASPAFADSRCSHGSHTQATHGGSGRTTS